MFTFVLFSSCINIYNYYCDCEADDLESKIKTLTLQPDAAAGKDSFIENYPLRDYDSRNFGDYPEFAASAWTAQGIPLTVRSLIEFDLSKIPDRSIIVSATLNLYASVSKGHGTGHSNQSGSNAFLLQQITEPWNEFTVCWNNQPSVSRDKQIFVKESTEQMQDYEIDVKPLIQKMIESGENYGMMLRLENETYYRRILFASSDHEQANLHPKLTIKYK